MPIDCAFYGCNNLTDIYYKGTMEEWNEIEVSGNNSYLLNAIRYYFSEEEPTTEGNYWHYDENGNVVVWE